MQPPKHDRSDAQSLSLIDRTSIAFSYLMAIEYAYNEYFLRLINRTIVVVNSSSLTTIKNITSLFTSGIRGVIFLDSGRTMVVTSDSNRTIVFLHQNGNISFNDIFVYQKITNYMGVDRLTSYNDNCFYVTS